MFKGRELYNTLFFNHILVLQVILYISFSSAYGQSKTDSLRLAINANPDSTELYLKAARPLLFSQLDSAYQYLLIAETLALKHQSLYEQARVYDNFGIYYGIQSKYDSATYYYQKSITNYKEIGEEYALANVLNNFGLTLYKKGDYEQSIKRYLEAVELYTKLNETSKIARTTNNLGLIFTEINDLDRAISYFEQAQIMAKEAGNEQTYFMALNGKANIVANTFGNYREGKVLFDSVYTYFKNSNQSYFQSRAGKNLGDCLKNLGEYTKANWYYQESLSIKKSFGDKEVIISGYNALADLAISQKNYKLAIVFLDSAQTLAEQLNNLSRMAYIIKYKSDALYKLKNYQQSAQLYAKSIILIDSLNQVEQTSAITELNNKYEVAKKDKELADLQLENEKKNQEIKLTKIRFYSIGVLILLLATGTIFYLFQLRQRDKLRQALLNEEMDGLRLRISSIMSDIQLEEIEISKNPIKNSVLAPLTEREIEILKQAVTNKTNAEIGEALYISPNTVKYHLKNIYTKIGVSSKLEARAYFS